MISSVLVTGLLVLAPLVASLGLDIIHREPAADPCTVIAGKTWVAPQDVRACFQSFKVDEVAKENILDVTTKTLAFHTNLNYQIKASDPFTADVHEDLLADLARIRAQTYASDYDLHIDVSRSFKRLNDGHCVWINACYDSLFVNYLPIPLALFTDSKGIQSIHITPEAFVVASAEFPDQIDVWQDALPGALKGNLKSLSGAQVLLINDGDPWVAVDANALITGSFQGFGTRQNSFFASYNLAATGWNYILGNFAQQALPLSDSVTLTILRTNHTVPERFSIPYRSRIGTATIPFTDTASWRANNCVAVEGTNGADLYASSASAVPNGVVAKFQQQPPTPPTSERIPLINVMLDTTPLSDVVLPPILQPTAPPVNGSFGVGTFYMQNDGKTGVLALGSFSGAAIDTMMSGLLQGLVTLKSQGATQLIVDVTNNGGGFICVAHFLHRIIIGPKASTVPQAGLDTAARAGPLAQQIVKQIIDNNVDPDDEMLYNPLQWRSANNTDFGAHEDWLEPGDLRLINGRKDLFSQRLGQECQPEGFTTDPPNVALFDPSKVIIVSNGRCASSCSLFSITMSKEEGVKTVVIGGKNDVGQQYCGTVGGQSSDYSTMDTEIKTAHLKNSSLAPPDLIVNGVQGITWRQGFGIDDTQQPEEWQNHPATLNLPLTPGLVNNPTAIWTEVAARLFK